MPRHCFSCEAKKRVELNIKSQVEADHPKKPEAQARSLAGLSVVLVPYEPKED